MFRLANAGDGVRSSDYPSITPLFGATGPCPGVLDGEFHAGAADSQAGRAWSGTGGRWRLWPLRAVLWTALLVIAFCGVTAIVFNTSAPACGPGIGERRRRLAAR